MGLSRILQCLALLFQILGGLLTVQAGAAGEEGQPRIVSLGGDVTEIAYALGLADQIVAVDSTSLYPAQVLREKKNVGYLRTLSSEGVLSVAPTLILASEGAGPPETVRTLKGSSAPYVTVPEAYTPEGIIEKIRIVARATRREAQAKSLIQSVNASFEQVKRVKETIGKPLRVLFILSAANRRFIIGGRGTSADAIIKLSGSENAAGDVSGFKPVGDEALTGIAPDAIIVMEGGRQGLGPKEIAGLNSVALSPAGRLGRVRSMDGLLMLGFGPRTADAVRTIIKWLYPEASMEF